MVYCLENDSLVIEKLGEYSSGDSLIITFQEDFTNTQFSTFLLHDSLFTKYNGQVYLLGDNNAQIGDIWHPLRFQFMSFSDSSQSCQNLMNVEVTGIDNINFDGQVLKRFTLLDLDLEFNTTYEYMEGIGVTIGGPLYNLTQQYNCDIWTDFMNPELKYFSNANDVRWYMNECPQHVGQNELDNSIKLFQFPDNIRIECENLISLSLINSLGEEVRSCTTDVIELNSLLPGFYLLRIQTENDFVVRRLHL